MKLKRTSSDPFSAMLRNSCRKTRFIPIITFISLFLVTIGNYFETRSASYSRDFIYYPTDSVNPLSCFGFFWNNLADPLIIFPIVFGGFIAAIVLFSFVHSKKQCNVIFSLGLSRKKIFLAKYLGGTLPFIAAVIIAAFFELISAFCSGFEPCAPLIKIAVYYVACFTGIYTLSFTVTAAAIAHTGNIVEGMIFTVIIAVFPMVFGIFFGLMRGFYTLGGISVYEGRWNFFNPFLYMFDFTGADFFSGSDFSQYFYYINGDTPRYYLGIYNFSGAIMDFVYSAIIFTIAYLAFSKRKNEISGTFGRSKKLNEICAAMCGIYVATFLLEGVSNISEGGFLTFLFLIVFFLVPYFIFKMIFGHKRKKILKSMLKKIPAYIAAIAVVTVIFSSGLFGYASRIPDAEDVASIEFACSVVNPYSTINDVNPLRRSLVYGYAEMNAYSGYSTSSGPEILTSGSGYQNTYYSPFSVDDENQIRKLIETHRSFVQKGHIKDSASDSCAINFQIIYTLKNGKTIKRYYTKTTEENAKRIMGLSDFDVIKNAVSDFFVYNEYTDVYEDIPIDKNPLRYFYLHSKFLKYNYSCAVITDELKEAVLKDLENQTAEDIFFHKPEDELGVICFGMNSKYDYYLPDGYSRNDDGEIVDNVTEQIVSENSLIEKYASDMLQKRDISVNAMYNNPKSIVLTKSMTNTIKYLTDKGFIKYLKTDITSSDVKSIKLATRAESFGAKNADMLPLFSGGYSSTEDIKEFDELYDSDYEAHSFKQFVNNEITNKSTIQKVLDNCFLYGYCGNDYRVVEVTFNDGSIATYCITGEVYEKLMK